MKIYYNVENSLEVKDIDVCFLWGEKNCRGLIFFIDYKFKVLIEV